MTLSMRGRWREALRAYQDALSVDPRDAKNYRAELVKEVGVIAPGRDLKQLLRGPRRLQAAARLVRLPGTLLRATLRSRELEAGPRLFYRRARQAAARRGKPRP